MISRSASFNRPSFEGRDCLQRSSRSGPQASLNRSAASLRTNSADQRGRSARLFTHVATVRQRNKQRKAIETMFGVSSICCIVLLAARYRQDQWASMYSNYAVFPAFVISLVLSVVWIIQLIQIYNQPALKITQQEQILAGVKDDEDGFEIVGSEEPAKGRPFESIDFSRTMSSLISSRSTEPDSSRRSILLVKPLDPSGHSSFDDSRVLLGGSDGSYGRSFESRKDQSIARNGDVRPYIPGIPNPLSVNSDESLARIDFYQKYDVGRAVATLWRENLRKWFCKNLLSPVAEEIDSLNKALSPARLKIGVDSIERLKSSAASLSSIDGARLKKLLPYMELSSSQGYVVKRIRELSQYCLSAYRWNSGGQFEGKPWTELYPTDCDLLFHFFCTFMDSLYPANALHLDGRYFVEYFTRGVVSTSKPINEPVMIYKYDSSPSAFKLLVSGEEVNVEQGQYNMFDAIIGFLYIVDKNMDGQLGSVNLRYTGLGLLRTVTGN